MVGIKAGQRKGISSSKRVFLMEEGNEGGYRKGKLFHDFELGNVQFVNKPTEHSHYLLLV